MTLSVCKICPNFDIWGYGHRSKRFEGSRLSSKIILGLQATKRWGSGLLVPRAEKILGLLGSDQPPPTTTIFNSLAALVRKILFCHWKIKFISSRHRVISSIYSQLRLKHIPFFALISEVTSQTKANCRQLFQMDLKKPKELYLYNCIHRLRTLDYRSK